MAVNKKFYNAVTDIVNESLEGLVSASNGKLQLLDNKRVVCTKDEIGPGGVAGGRWQRS